ncbi:hypothetical protein EMGBS6_14070, partial [Opitutia bacterium]
SHHPCDRRRSGDFQRNWVLWCHRQHRLGYGHLRRFIQGNLYLIKAGAGTLRLTGANTNSSTGVSEGILEIGQGGSMLNVDVGGGVLSFNRPDSFTRSSDTSGSGSVTILGGGNMTLTGTFNHNGGTNVASGQILTLGNGGSIGGAGVLTVDGSLKVNNTGSASIGATIGGSAASPSMRVSSSSRAPMSIRGRPRSLPGPPCRSATPAPSAPCLRPQSSSTTAPSSSAARAA